MKSPDEESVFMREGHGEKEPFLRLKMQNY